MHKSMHFSLQRIFHIKSQASYTSNKSFTLTFVIRNERKRKTQHRIDYFQVKNFIAWKGSFRMSCLINYKVKSYIFSHSQVKSMSAKFFYILTSLEILIRFFFSCHFHCLVVILMSHEYQVSIMEKRRMGLLAWNMGLVAVVSNIWIYWQSIK